MPPVPPPPSSEALNGSVLDPLDPWPPSTSRFTHQQVRWGMGRTQKSALGPVEGVWQGLGEPRKLGGRRGRGRKRLALPTGCHVKGQ